MSGFISDWNDWKIVKKYSRKTKSYEGYILGYSKALNDIIDKSSEPL